MTEPHGRNASDPTRPRSGRALQSQIRAQDETRMSARRRRNSATVFVGGATRLGPPGAWQNERICPQATTVTVDPSCEDWSRLGRGRPENQADAVEAVPFAGRGRPVVEDVTQVAAATVAMDLCPHGEEASVGLRRHGIGQRLPE